MWNTIQQVHVKHRAVVGAVLCHTAREQCANTPSRLLTWPLRQSARGSTIVGAQWGPLTMLRRHTTRVGVPCTTAPCAHKHAGFSSSKGSGQFKHSPLVLAVLNSSDTPPQGASPPAHNTPAKDVQACTSLLGHTSACVAAACHSACPPANSLLAVTDSLATGPTQSLHSALGHILPILGIHSCRRINVAPHTAHAPQGHTTGVACTTCVSLKQSCPRLQCQCRTLTAPVLR
jgi:hypothetical protein